MTLESLRAAVAAGQRFTYLFFWGHTAPRDGRVDKHVLSQWWVAPFEVDGRRYATAEHWMMAGKARLFGDDEALERILDAPSPQAVKALGRQVRGFDEATWKAHRFDIVVEGNRHKFAQHPELAAWLVGTGKNVLVEASPYDRVWGVGLKGDDARAKSPATWRGQNLLGFALMEVREGLG